MYTCIYMANVIIPTLFFGNQQDFSVSHHCKCMPQSHKMHYPTIHHKGKGQVLTKYADFLSTRQSHKATSPGVSR